MLRPTPKPLTTVEKKAAETMAKDGKAVWDIVERLCKKRGFPYPDPYANELYGIVNAHLWETGYRSFRGLKKSITQGIDNMVFQPDQAIRRQYANRLKAETTMLYEYAKRLAAKVDKARKALAAN